MKLKNVPKYKYEKIEILKVYDADTITIRIHLGFGVTFNKITLRLARINAWEVRGKEKKKGIKARDYVMHRLLENSVRPKKVWIETYKDGKGKFGRYLADFYIGKECINDTLVKEGHARYQNY